MPAPNLSAVERAYFIRKLGGTQPAYKPLNQIEREYFIGFTGAASPQTSLGELEYRWQLKFLVNAGYSEDDMDRISDLWKEMVVAIGKTPSSSLTANQMTFYLNAP
jgi:hypothetical protein